MMSRRFALASLVLALLLTALNQPAQAKDDRTPRQIFENCVEHLRQTVRRCHNHQGELTQDCVERIRRLKAAGREEEAAATARRCVRRLNEFSDQCVEAVHQTCRRCINALLEKEAPELARRLRQICQNSVEAIRDGQERSIKAIRRALNS